MSKTREVPYDLNFLERINNVDKASVWCGKIGSMLWIHKYIYQDIMDFQFLWMDVMSGPLQHRGELAGLNRVVTYRRLETLDYNQPRGVGLVNPREPTQAYKDGEYLKPTQPHELETLQGAPSMLNLGEFSLRVLDPMSLMVEQVGKLKTPMPPEADRMMLRELAGCVGPYMQDATIAFAKGEMKRNPAVAARRLWKDIQSKPAVYHKILDDTVTEFSEGYLKFLNIVQDAAGSAQSEYYTLADAIQ